MAGKMHKKRGIRLLLALLCIMTLPVSVSAAQNGSLLIVDTEEAVSLFQVADAGGTLLPDFATAPVENLQEETNMVKNAKVLAEHAKQESLIGDERVPDAMGNVSYTPLEEGIYLICSMASDAEFNPFLVFIPTQINGEAVYDINAKPKEEIPPESTDPTVPTVPTEPSEPPADIPQTGNSVWPKYLLLIFGTLSVLLGIADLLHGREKQYE
jgi:hypothetical protein